MTKRADGRHRAVELGVDAVDLPRDDPGTPVIPDPLGRFAVQLLDGHWFVGPHGAAQRVENPQWLDSWLAANGTTSRAALDFAGDRDLEQRFHSEFGGSR
jgi:hypothetical protein